MIKQTVPMQFMSMSAVKYFFVVHYQHSDKALLA